MMPTTKDAGATEARLHADSIVLDGGTQSRAAISEATVEEYADALEAADEWPFPPLAVFHDGNRHLLAGGFHRTLAARRVGWSDPIPCEVRQGTAWDALVFGMADNHEHGLRPTRDDRRRNVGLLLDSGKGLTQQQIADMAGVSLRTVSLMVAERKPADAQIAHSGRPATDRPAPANAQIAHSEPAEPDDDPSWEAPPPAVRTNDSAAPEKPPGRDEFAIQRSKTVKTIEALMRAFDDLNSLRASMVHKAAIAGCKNLLERARNW